MKEIILIFVAAFSVFLSSPLYINAQENTHSGERYRIESNEKINQNEIDKESARTEIQKRVEERKAIEEDKARQIRKERIRNRWGILERRISATIERLEILTARIELRIEKMSINEPETDFSDVIENIDKAKILLAEATIALGESSEYLDNLLETDNPKGAFEQLKEMVMDIKDMLIETHRMLVSAIGDIKGLRVGSQTAPANKLSPTTVVPKNSGEIIPTVPTIDN